MYLEARKCILSVVYKPSVGRGLRLEDVSRRKKMYFEQTCGFFSEL